jgi:hypothetical protein
MAILLDSRDGSYPLAHHEPLRSLLAVCGECGGAAARRSLTSHRLAGTGGKRVQHSPPPPCSACRGTGRTLHTLPSADIAIPGHGPDGDILIGVEVKSIPDLLSSLDDGRLQDTQIGGMRRDYDIAWLLYYGLHRPGLEGELEVYQLNGGGRPDWYPYTRGGSSTKPIGYSYLKAAVAEIATQGIRVDHVGGWDADSAGREIAHWVVTLHDLFAKQWHEHRLMSQIDTSGERFTTGNINDPKLKQRVKTLMSFPGIRDVRAMALAKAYPSLRALVNAGPAAWADVVYETPSRAKGKGGVHRGRIGPVIAEALERAVGE